MQMCTLFFSSTISKTSWVLQLVAPEVIEKSVWRDLAVICYYSVFLIRKLYGPMHLNNIIYAENTNKNIKKNYTKYFVNWECDLKFIKKDDPWNLKIKIICLNKNQ